MPSLTFATLSKLLISLKQVLNIDDDRTFAFGHSDGSDGATGLGVYRPDQFAAIVAYNTMLKNLFVKDFYIRNIPNRPLYVVHSDLDNLRPIGQTRQIIKQLQALGDSINYKEYYGYQHQDKHLDIDRPRVLGFMKDISRNVYRHQLYWGSASTLYGECD